MANTILCVFEGERRDIDYFSSVQQHFFPSETLIKCSYGNDLYHLRNELEHDEDLDIVELIRESTTVPSNRVLLAGIEREEIAEVFLFFDMEPHDDQYAPDKLQHLIERFNEETEFGKLYVSYPMIEALRDVPSFDLFLNLMVDIDQCRGKVYKNLSEQRRQAIPQDYRRMTRKHWLDLTSCSIQKAYNIVGIPEISCPEQIQIFTAQSQVLTGSGKIYVLSAFPFFLQEYFGESLDNK